MLKKNEKPDWWKQRRKVRWVRIYRPLWSAALWSRWRSPHLFWIMMIRKQTLMPNMAFDVFCIFWQKCEATKGSQCPAGYSHNRASIYIMTGRDMLLPRIRLFARTPKVASSREAAQSQSRRWLIEVFSFLEIDSITIFKPKKGFHFFYIYVVFTIVAKMIVFIKLTCCFGRQRWPSRSTRRQPKQSLNEKSNLKWQFDILFIK